MYKFISWNIDSLNAALTSDSARAQRIKTSKINNSGWRIDYFPVSNRIKDRIVESGMMDSGERQY
jgi:exonuclease III